MLCEDIKSIFGGQNLVGGDVFIYQVCIPSRAVLFYKIYTKHIQVLLSQSGDSFVLSLLPHAHYLY